MLVTAFGMCAIPFCKKAAILTIMMCGIGTTMGILDTGKNIKQLVVNNSFKWRLLSVKEWFCFSLQQVGMSSS